MPCEVCGKESGKYPLCKECFDKRKTGEVIKCDKCHKWHYANFTCEGEPISNEDDKYLYEPKSSIITKNEFEYFKCIKSVLPQEYLIHMQANLASFIIKTDVSRFQNELYRNVDFLITDLKYKPLAVIEINDKTHLSKERYERDEKVAKICEEAGIPIIKLWTSYGINPEYIEKRIDETLKSLPVKRIHHFEIGNDEFKKPCIKEKEDSRKELKKSLKYVEKTITRIALLAVLVILGILFVFSFLAFPFS